MRLKTFTYTSLASLDLTAGDLAAILTTARHRNAIEGITGLLIFNGVRFLQIVEGPEAAIDSLVTELRRDHRHSGFEVQDERVVEERSFPEWSMELVQVSTTFLTAREEVNDRLPSALGPAIRQLVIRNTERIGAPVTLPD